MTPKQRIFAKEYLVDFNATQAALRAGYSERAAGSIGNENLKKPEIQRAIKEAAEMRERKLDLSADRTLSAAAQTAFSNICNIIAWKAGDSGNTTVRIKNSEEIEGNAAAAIKDATFSEDGSFTITMHSKLPAIDLLMRHHGLVGHAIGGHPPRRNAHP